MIFPVRRMPMISALYTQRCQVWHEVRLPPGSGDHMARAAHAEPRGQRWRGWPPIRIGPHPHPHLPKEVGPSATVEYPSIHPHDNRPLSQYLASILVKSH